MGKDTAEWAQKEGVCGKRSLPMRLVLTIFGVLRYKRYVCIANWGTLFRISSGAPLPCFAGTRWANMWPPESFADSLTPTTAGASGEALDEESYSGGELNLDDDAESDVFPRLTSDLSSAVFMGNFLLFVALLLGIYLIHVALVSAVEAYWLTKVRMIRIANSLTRNSGVVRFRLRTNGVNLQHGAARFRLRTNGVNLQPVFAGSAGRQNIYPTTVVLDCFPQGMVVSVGAKGPLGVVHLLLWKETSTAFLVRNFLHPAIFAHGETFHSFSIPVCSRSPQKRASEEISRARHMGIPVSRLSVRSNRRRIQPHDPNAGSSPRPPPVGTTSAVCGDEACDINEEVGY